MQVIPQLLAKDGELAAWMIGELRRMGYTEVNLNFGCPSGTVTAKGKGSGMLWDSQKLDAFLDAVFSQAGGPVSVKTRLGVARAEEFGEILNVYNKYPRLRADHPSPGDETALPRPGRPGSLCCLPARLHCSGLLQRRCDYRG